MLSVHSCAKPSEPYAQRSRFVAAVRKLVISTREIWITSARSGAAPSTLNAYPRRKDKKERTEEDWEEPGCDYGNTSFAHGVYHRAWAIPYTPPGYGFGAASVNHLATSVARKPPRDTLAWKGRLWVEPHVPES